MRWKGLTENQIALLRALANGATLRFYFPQIYRLDKPEWSAKRRVEGKTIHSLFERGLLRREENFPCTADYFITAKGRELVESHAISGS